MSESCIQCGGEPVVDINFPQVSENWNPHCDGCYQDVKDTTQEIYDFEMSHFGGAYGLPTYNVRAIGAINGL
jgi:hypothetical protein